MKSEYMEMSNMLQDSVYKKLKRDPKRSTEIVKSSLKSLLKEHRISKRRFDLLTPSGANHQDCMDFQKYTRRTFLYVQLYQA